MKTKKDDRLDLLQQLVARDIRDPRVLQAIGDTPRELFVPDDEKGAAYADRALPIAAGQTISQPYMVALMTEELRLQGTETVLEIGTGSGYQTAILARLCERVVTIERIEDLSVQAQRLLDSLGFKNIEFHIGDGSLGWPETAPYQRILVTAGAPAIPRELYRQLAEGGRMVIPVGTGSPLKLQAVVKSSTGPVVTDVCDCSFVPLIGASGWSSEDRTDTSD